MGYIRNVEGPLHLDNFTAPFRSYTGTDG